MAQNITSIFAADKSERDFLFILEMANNHMGDFNHASEIITHFYEKIRKYPFLFAFKFQFRHLSAFIHPDYKQRSDIPYIDRFTKTKLTTDEYQKLAERIKSLGMITMATPFDEQSVDLIDELNLDIIKIGSCSFNDWPLLERIVKSNKPVIASTAGISLAEIDKVVSFLQHRDKKLVLMHCIGEYPTKEEHLQINQIDLLLSRYQNIPVGFSTHEDPALYESVALAIAKGATVFEKHIALATPKYQPNKYSASPDQVDSWLKTAQIALLLCGLKGKRIKPAKKELHDIRQFQRGVFAKLKIEKGETVNRENTFLAFPNAEGQLLANDLSKYTAYHTLSAVNKNAPVIKVKKTDNRDKIYKIIVVTQKLLKKENIILPNKLEVEISHHYGLSKFSQFGAVIINCINRDYCKKIIVMFKGQIHPTQYHKAKEETFYILKGNFKVTIDGVEKIFNKGDMVNLPRGTKHEISANTDGVIEEISSTHYREDSYYIDSSIMLNKNRKTVLTLWGDEL